MSDVRIERMVEEINCQVGSKYRAVYRSNVGFVMLRNCTHRNATRAVHMKKEDMSVATPQPHSCLLGQPLVVAASSNQSLLKGVSAWTTFCLLLSSNNHTLSVLCI